MAKGLPFFPLYASEFMNDERYKEMNLKERGLYLTLLLHAWVEGSIPGDPVRIGRIAGATADEMTEIWPLVSPCFHDRGDGRLVNPRMEIERAKAVEVFENRSTGSRKKVDKQARDAGRFVPTDSNDQSSGDGEVTVKSPSSHGGTSTSPSLHREVTVTSPSGHGEVRMNHVVDRDIEIQETSSPTTVSSLRSETEPPISATRKTAGKERAEWKPSIPPEDLSPLIPEAHEALRDYARWFMSEYGNLRDDVKQDRRIGAWVNALDALRIKGANTKDAARLFCRARLLKGGIPLFGAECKSIPPMYQRSPNAPQPGRSNQSQPTTVVVDRPRQYRQSLVDFENSMTPEEREEFAAKTAANFAAYQARLRG